MALRLVHEHVVDEAQLQQKCAVHAPTNTVYVYGRRGLAAFAPGGHCLCEQVNASSVELSLLPSGKLLGLYCHIASSTVWLCILPSGSFDVCVSVFDLQLRQLGSVSLAAATGDVRDLILGFSGRYGELCVATAHEILVYSLGEFALQLRELPRPAAAGEAIATLQHVRRLTMPHGLDCISVGYQDATGMLVCLVVDPAHELSQHLLGLDRLSGASLYQLDLQKARDTEPVLELVCDNFSSAVATVAATAPGPEGCSRVVMLWDASVAARHMQGSVQLPAADAPAQLQMVHLTSFAGGSTLVLAVVSESGRLEVWRGQRIATLQPLELVAAGQIPSLSVTVNKQQSLGGLAAESTTSGVAVIATLPTCNAPVIFGADAIMVHCVGSQAICTVVVHDVLCSGREKLGEPLMSSTDRQCIAGLHALQQHRHDSGVADPCILAVSSAPVAVTLHHGPAGAARRLPLEQPQSEQQQAANIQLSAIAQRSQLLACSATRGQLRVFNFVTGQEIALPAEVASTDSEISALSFADVLVSGAAAEADAGAPQLVGSWLLAGHTNGDVALVAFDRDWLSCKAWIKRSGEAPMPEVGGEAVCGLYFCDSSTTIGAAHLQLCAERDICTSSIVALSRSGRLVVWRCELSSQANVADCKQIARCCTWSIAGIAQVAPATSRQCASFAVEPGAHFAAVGTLSGRLSVWRIPGAQAGDVRRRAANLIQTTKAASSSVDIHAGPVHALRFESSVPAQGASSVAYLCSSSADQSAVLWQFTKVSEALEPLIRLWFLAVPLEAICVFFPDASGNQIYPRRSVQLVVRFEAGMLTEQIDVQECRKQQRETACRRVGCLPLATSTAPVEIPAPSTAAVVYTPMLDREVNAAGERRARAKQSPSMNDGNNESFSFETSMRAATNRPRPVAVAAPAAAQARQTSTAQDNRPPPRTAKAGLATSTPRRSVGGIASVHKPSVTGLRMADEANADLILPGKYVVQAAPAKPGAPAEQRAAAKTPNEQHESACVRTVARVPGDAISRQSVSAAADRLVSHGSRGQEDEAALYLVPKGKQHSSASTGPLRDTMYTGDGFFAAPNLYERNLEQSICRFTTSNHTLLYNQRAAQLLHRHTTRAEAQRARFSAASHLQDKEPQAGDDSHNVVCSLPSSARDARIPRLMQSGEHALSDNESTSDSISQVAHGGTALGWQEVALPDTDGLHPESNHSGRSTGRASTDAASGRGELVVQSTTTRSVTLAAGSSSTTFRAFLLVAGPDYVPPSTGGHQLPTDEAELAAMPGVAALHVLPPNLNANSNTVTVGNLEGHRTYTALLIDASTGVVRASVSFVTIDAALDRDWNLADLETTAALGCNEPNMLSDLERSVEAAIASTLDTVAKLAVAARQGVPDPEDRSLSEQRAPSRAQQFQRFLAWYFDSGPLAADQAEAPPTTLSPQRAAFRQVELSAALQDAQLRALYEQSRDGRAENFPSFPVWYRQVVLGGPDRSVRGSFLCRLERKVVLARRGTVLSQVWDDFPCACGPSPNSVNLLPLLSMLQSPYVEQERRFLLWPSRDPRSFKMAEILSWLTPEEDKLEDRLCVDAEAYAREMERLEHYRQSMCIEDQLAAQLRSYSNRLAVVDVVQVEENPHQQDFTFLVNLPGEYQQLQHHRLLYALGTGLNNGDEEYDAMERMRQEQEARRREAAERKRAEQELQRQRLEAELRLKEAREREERLRVNAERRKRVRAHLAEVRAQRSIARHQAELEQQRLATERERLEAMRRLERERLEAEERVAQREQQELQLMRREESEQRSYETWAREVALMTHEDLRSQILEAQWRADDEYKVRRVLELKELYAPFEPFDFGRQTPLDTSRPELLSPRWAQLHPGRPPPLQAYLRSHVWTRSRDWNCATFAEVMADDMDLIADTFALSDPSAYESVVHGIARSAALRRMLRRDRSWTRSLNQALRTVTKSQGHPSTVLLPAKKVSDPLTAHDDIQLPPPERAAPATTKSAGQRPASQQRSAKRPELQDSAIAVEPGSAEQLRTAKLPPRSSYPSGASADFRQVRLPPPFVRATFGVAGRPLGPVLR